MTGALKKIQQGREIKRLTHLSLLGGWSGKVSIRNFAERPECSEGISGVCITLQRDLNAVRE